MKAILRIPVEIHPNKFGRPTMCAESKGLVVIDCIKQSVDKTFDIFDTNGQRIGLCSNADIEFGKVILNDKTIEDLKEE